MSQRGAAERREGTEGFTSGLESGALTQQDLRLFRVYPIKLRSPEHCMANEEQWFFLSVGSTSLYDTKEEEEERFKLARNKNTEVSRMKQTVDKITVLSESWKGYFASLN